MYSESLLILTWFSFQALNLLLLVQTPNEWVVGVGFSLRYAEIPLFAVLSARLAVRSPNSSTVAVLLGILSVLYTARKRGGNTADLLQYGAVYAIAFGIVGVIATIVIHRVLA